MRTANDITRTRRTLALNARDPAMNLLKEISKFASGAEAFHAFIHTYFRLSGTTVQAFGLFDETPTVHLWGAIVNATISFLLGFYAWGAPRRRR